MVSPLSGWVLIGAALLTSPSWYAVLVEGTMPLETAATRGAIAMALVWVGLSMLGSLLDGTSERRGGDRELESGPDPADRPR